MRNKKVPLLLFGVFLCFLFFFIFISKESIPFNAEKEHKIDDMLEKHHFKGTVLMVQNGQVVFEKAYGQADHERKTANTLETIFPIASLQKRMTAVIIAQLIAEGKLSYETKLADYCPEVRGAQKITIRQLLDHTSGYVMPEIAPVNVLKTEEAQYDYALQLTTVYEPGTYQYSNGNYTFLARVIHLIEKKTYADVLKERIIQPLGLKNTFLWDEIPKNKQVPEEYMYLNGDYTTQKRVASPALFSSLLGAGNVFSSVNDLLLFEKSLSDNQLLTHQEMEIVFDWSFEQPKKKKMIRGNISEAGQLGGYDSAVYGTLDNQNLVFWLSNQAPVDQEGQLLNILYEIMMY
ncbi:serine hydrolase domain-containing protein [Vagococcus sp.]|uniref:serine hydrolase domain-containing protein n=1 Tax=Vagococcus sp. TaxID=1933889 RepID=UPI003F999E52